MRKQALLLTVGLILNSLSGCAVNPLTGDEELMFYPEEKDILIGQKYAPKVEKELGGKIANDELQSYINSVGQRIARFSHRPDLEYNFVALDDEAVNAFALPGGYIFILKGLLEKMKNEAQLAALLGHEITHVVARDHMAALSRNQIANLLLITALALDAPADAIGAASYTSFFLNMRYSREDERYADLTGLDYMVAAGYNPMGAVELLQLLEEENTSRRVEFFSTHPSPRNRKAYINQAIEQKYQNIKNLRTARQDYEQNVLLHITKKRLH